MRIFIIILCECIINNFSKESMTQICEIWLLRLFKIGF